MRWAGRWISQTGWEQGCLTPDLATESSAFGEQLRSRLVDVMQRQVAAFETVLGEALKDADGRDMAAFVIAAWHGTLLRMKAERSQQPIDRFRCVLHSLLSRR